MADGGPNPLPPGLPNDSQIIWLTPIAHDGSMVLLYMVCHGSHQYTPFMLAYIPAPWIRHGYYIDYIDSKYVKIYVNNPTIIDTSIIYH